MKTETLQLAAALTDESQRRERARAFARHLGAEDLIVFVEDPEIGISLPAPGFPQTLPGGSAWRDFIEECRREGVRTGELVWPGVTGAESRVTGVGTPDGTVLVLRGEPSGLPGTGDEPDCLLALLGAVFRAERRALAAEGRVRVTRAAAVEARELAEKLERTRAQLQQALIRAETASRLKDDFLATVSHELRTPLNAILGWARMLETLDLDPDTVRKGVEAIERNARTQIQLIEDLLDISQIITGRFNLKVGTVALSDVVRTAAEAFRPTAGAKHIEFSVEADPETGWIRGDPDRLRQIVWNLLSNAFKFTAEGGRVGVSVRTAGPRVELVVRDTGIGIEPDFMPYVFDRFRQSDASESRRHGGLGLGLSIVRQLTEMHGGTVRAESAGAGRGAVFTVSLPHVRERAAEGTVGRDLPDPPDGGTDADRERLSGLRVLFLGNGPGTDDLTGLILNAFGAEVTEAPTDEAAVSLVREKNFHVLIRDFGPADPDGRSLIRQIRELEAAGGTKDLPAIALSARKGEKARAGALEAGYHLLLSRPFEPAELVAAVAELGGA